MASQIRVRVLVCLAVAALLFVTLPVRAQQVAPETSVPRLVQFSGALKDAAARPLSGAASVTFAIYAEQDGGTALWSETQNVIADANGHYNALLGGATPTGLPAELFGTGQPRWLGVTIARQPEMPRVLLASVPYALKAGDAETLGGLPASAYVTTQSLAAAKSSTSIFAPGSAAITSTPAATLPITNTAPTGGGTTNYIPLWTSSSALSNSILFQTGGQIGIGTKTPAETLDVNGNSIFRGSFQLPPGHPATAASGYESHSFQFQASSFNSGTATSNTEAFGFRAEPLSNNTTNPSAKLDLFFGAGGSAPFTDTGLSFAANGVITFAPGQTFPGSSSNVSEINLPNTTSSTSGVITMGGVPFVSNPGVQNAFFGASAGAPFTTSGYYNTAVGDQSLAADTTGADNTAVGASALNANLNGSSNVAVGEAALFATNSGAGNTAVGAGAGTANTTGNSNTFVGVNSNASLPGLTNATAIGANSEVQQDNTMVLGSIKGVNGATASTRVGIGTGFPGGLLGVDASGYGNAIEASTDVNGATAIEGFSGSDTGVSYGGYFSAQSPDGSAIFATNQTINGMAAEFLGNVHLDGNLYVSGTLTKGGGAFKIDDPLDPAGKYLSHSFVESADMMNIYNGNVVTNAKGYAVVTLPEWFEALNSDFRYQLTPVGQFAQAMVASKIKNRKFTIRTSKPHVEISWQVTGIRHDAYANAHRIPTEEVKPPNEQGHYLHPELFGAGPEQGIGSAAMAANNQKH